MTTPSTGITKGISLRAAFASEQVLDTASASIIRLGAQMNGQSFGGNSPVMGMKNEF